MENIKTLSNDVLVGELKKLCGVEKQTTAEVVRCLAEVALRKLYREMGYSSLFSFCTIYLGYSSSSAYRRIEAACLLIKNSEVFDLLNEGKVTLCSLSQVAKVVTPENKEEVFSLVQGLNKDEAQKLASRYQAPGKVKRDTCRAKRVVVDIPSVSNARCEITSAVEVVENYSLSFDIDEECMELLKQAKEFAGHKKMGELLKIVLKEYLRKKSSKSPAPEKTQSPRKTNTGKTPVVESRVLSNSRYIKRGVRDLVRMRDNGQCSFVAADGTRCCERTRLQYDHIVPFARGGSRNLGNIRLLCPAHNQLHAEMSFGKGFMDNKRNQRLA